MKLIEKAKNLLKTDEARAIDALEGIERELARLSFAVSLVLTHKPYEYHPDALYPERKTSKKPMTDDDPFDVDAEAINEEREATYDMLRQLGVEFPDDEDIERQHQDFELTQDDRIIANSGVDLDDFIPESFIDDIDPRDDTE